MGALTPNLGLTVPTVGGDTGPLYAQEINGDLTLLDSCMGGVNSLNVGGNANITLNTSQSQNLIQSFTGALTGTITVFLPATGRFYAIENGTTGAFGLFVGCTGGGNLQLIPQGLSTWIWTDGSFTRLSNPPGWQEIATYVVSSAAIQIVSLPGPFRRFRLTFQSLLVSTNSVNMAAQVSQDGGSTFISTGYIATYFSVTTSSVTTANGTSSGTDFFLTVPVANVNPSDGTLEIWTGKSTSVPFIARGNSFGVLNTIPAWTMLNFAATCTGSGMINAIRLFPTAGTFSGTLIVEGLP